MTVELMERKWPVGTRIKTTETDLFGNKLVLKGTVTGDYNELSFDVKFDNGQCRSIWPGYDHFSVICHE